MRGVSHLLTGHFVIESGMNLHLGWLVQLSTVQGPSEQFFHCILRLAQRLLGKELKMKLERTASWSCLLLSNSEGEA